MKNFLILDYETRSEANLKKCGAYEYAVHPSTQVLCVAWKLGTREELREAKTGLWASHTGDAFPRELVAAMLDPNTLIVAHNALFEQVITSHVLPKHCRASGLANIHVNRWACTAAMAASHALPRNLEGACEVLKLPVQKDKMGKLLIRRHCVPRKPTKHDLSRWNDDPVGLNRLAQYCATDVDAETELFLTLPPLIPTEREVWMLNQRINLRGVHVDRQLVGTALIMIDEETHALTQEALVITDGVEPTKVQAVKTWLAENGVSLPNMQAKTVADAIASGLAQGDAKRVLEIRQAASRTSTAKYLAFEARTRADSRLRDLQLYHGASTGRESGMGVQPHNFPRGTLSDVDGAIEAILTGDRHWVRALHGEPMAALSSVLRGCIRATPGHQLFCGDFNAIEARVVFWVAEHMAGLKLFEDGADPYKEQATSIFSKPVNQITDDERFVGKQVILGCGFGMGPPKFKAQCKQFGRDISDALAKRAVSAYRTKHAPVVRLWSNLERAAIAAVRERGKRFKVNRTTWFVSGKFLYCELPSGRRLAYFGPEIRYETKWEQRRPVLYHWSVNSLTKKWECTGTYGGKLTENVVQAVARDCMVLANLRTEQAGYIPLINVHDELLTERKRGTGSLEEFEALMADPPFWAKDLPIKVKGWMGERYRK